MMDRRPLRFPVVRIVALVLLLLSAFQGRAQGFTVPFTSGAIPLCDTSVFTANVNGVGTLFPPWNPWSYSLQSLTINITTDHPQTLQILLTSPEGTELLLSAFNGAGGVNYTNCTFQYSGGASITTGTAPFTGAWMAEGGGLDVFDYENADGTWTITVIDTSCVNGGTGPGGNWTPGWYNGASANGGFFLYFENPPPPCPGWIPWGAEYLCPGETLDLQAFYVNSNNWYTYTYQLDFIPVADPTAISTPGTYEIQAIDPWDGCWYWATFEVYAQTQVDLGPDQVVDACTIPVDLTALFPLAGATPNWSLNGSLITTTAAASASVAGTYQLIGSNNGGCNDTALVTLTLNGGPSIGPDQDVALCTGTAADLTALYATAGLATSWTFQGSPFATPTAATAAGTYVLSATDASGCTSTATTNLTTTPQPDLGPDQQVALCSGMSTDLTALFAPTGNPTWTLSNVPVVDPTNVGTPGNYRLVDDNGSGCADTAFAEVTVVPGPDLGSDVSTALCAGEVIDLGSLVPSLGQPLIWTSAGVAIDPTAVATSGTYQALSTNADGCSDSVDVVVTVTANPVLGPDQALTVCDGVAVDLNVLFPAGSNTTAWTLNGVAVADPSSVLVGGEYAVMVTDPAGCTAVAAVALTVSPAPDLGADQEASVCDGTSFDLTALFSTAGLASSWTWNGTAVADPTAITTPGVHQLVVENAAGCTDTAVVDFSVNTAPDLGPDQTFTLCAWQHVDLTSAFATTGVDVVYGMNGTAVSDPSDVHDAGTYDLLATDANGCVDEASATVVNIDCLCEADFRFDAVCMQDPVHFAVLADSALVSAYWNFNGMASNSVSTEPSVLLHGEDVRVTLRAELTCGVVTVERMIHVPDCSDSCTVWIPSAFTPDGDGINDTWGWSGECVPKEFSAQVFDRWGEVVFATNDPYLPWDGAFGGKRSPVGVYVYQVAYRLPYQDHKEAKGSVTLVR